MTIRIAMWSGPRNISTAMMRSWENRTDCEVVDEPFYAYYLAKTQSPHPHFDEILASQSHDYKVVARQLSQGHCANKVQYQKQMTHHMLDISDLDWAKSIRHCFLIRDPAEVVSSYTQSRGVCSAEDIGIIRQAELYHALTQTTGQNIPVIDSNAVLADPEKQLTLLCNALQVDFQPEMLSWPKGPRDSDGVWASHWYHSVEKSTGFAKVKTTPTVLNSQQKTVVNEVLPSYAYLRSHCL